MNLDRYDYFLIVDLEATCCDQQTIKRHEMEIIEVGAVLVSATELLVVDEFQTFIRPVRNSKLTTFCQELTSIKQSDVDRAPLFPDAMLRFRSWLDQYSNFLFCSWGDYDKNQLEQDCHFHRVANPLGYGHEHLNIKKQFSTSRGLKRKFGMAEALEIANLPLSGAYHRGLDDARNMVKLMPFVLGRSSVNL